MSPSTEPTKVETKAEAEALIPLFKFQRILNQDQNGRRITLLGTINDEPAVYTLERAAFPSDPDTVSNFLTTLTNTANLGANDIYRWYMSNHSPTPSTPKPTPDLKLNLIYPCTASHVKKYTSQPLRYVTETPEIYAHHIKPYIERTQRTPARLDWIHNILDGITEQDDVVYRTPNYMTVVPASVTPPGFLLLPDLNWDRKTLAGLHLLALPQRRDISSIRDLRRSHVPWLRGMLRQIKVAAAKRGTELARENTGGGGGEVVEPDQVKCYVHYHPTYYHFHVHVVHVMLEAEGGTQSVGKAIGLESVVGMLEGLKGEGDPGLDSVDLTFHLGEESELWKRCFGRLKRGERVDLGDG